ICCIQAESKCSTAEENIAHVVSLLQDVGDCDLIVMPELWHIGYFAFDQYLATAEAIDGPFISLMCAEAQKRQTAMVIGSFVEYDPGHKTGHEAYYNTSAFIDASGQLQASYRKSHLFAHQSQEAELLTAGTQPVCVQTEFGKLALSTCYDLRFPELYRLLQEQGAEIIVTVAAWPLARLAAWRLFIQARAHENLAFHIACNAAGNDHGTQVAGHSMIVNPQGEILAEAGECEELLYVDLDIPAGLALRDTFPVLEHRKF
ncbi:MAG: carbon-nitrogen family hydrolase, partial [Planctomycetes bacterium]|nr:carbon-nitrogen family hydrolase [Planctomycetota bacterium]